MTNQSKFRLSVKVYDGNNGTRLLSLEGRNAWTLYQLIKAGERGCTPIDNPAPRWSAYVLNLRRMAIRIETVTEPHGGTFAGTHARYVLRTQIQIITMTMPEGGK